nr:MAG TPA: hypothetical protein [Caudoviricetes sp.]
MREIKCSISFINISLLILSYKIRLFLHPL